ncbi:hypothetical protein BAE44_0023851 [Dichanthelium oligosanthes]|uniref:RING-type domain-containing protein n=1 Tax=Dichanthelium oligosanthes TaxID=888268 RepID=A0A1E5UQJ5_9POAL|nr:hypothetical protein BAE44_0023851 [Dichanthelium oligosanthes]
MAARCLCRVAARAASSSAGSSSFRYLSVQKRDHAAMCDMPVALYNRRRMRRRSCGGEEEEQAEVGCVFCLSGIEEGSEIREIKCRHLFHRACLDRWLLARPLATCPLCRCRLLAAPSSSSLARALWEEEYEYEEEEDMMLFMACVHSRRSWLWPS